MASIGIDFGTANTVVAAVVDGRVQTLAVTPSALAFRQGRLRIGRDALQPRTEPPECVIQSVSRLLSTGGDSATNLGGKPFSAVEIAAEFLRRVKDDAAHRLDEPIERAVVTVVPSATAEHRAAITRACDLAGVNVLGLLDTPIAAANAVLDSTESPVAVLVYDLGIGCDVTLLRVADDSFTSIGRWGESTLGGDRFDEYILLRVLDYLQSKYGVSGRDFPQYDGIWRYASEQAKRQLSSSEYARIIIPGVRTPETQEISNVDFENMILGDTAHSMDGTREVLARCQMVPDDIDCVLPVGGSCHIPLVLKVLQQTFGAEKVRAQSQPELTAASGAALVAARMSQRDRGQGASVVPAFQPRAEEVVQMFRGLDLLVCDDEAAIRAASEKQRARRLHEKAIPSPETRLKAEEWFRNLAMLLNKSQRAALLDIVYRQFCNVADVSWVSRENKTIDHELITIFRNHALRSCGTDPGLADRFVLRYMKERGLARLGRAK